MSRINQVKEIERLNNLLREYADLEEQGLLLIMPFKVGDTVWVIENKGTFYRQIREYQVSEVSIKQVRWNSPRIHIGYIAGGHRRGFDSVGKTVFLTKEEAEKELERLERENERNKV